MNDAVELVSTSGKTPDSDFFYNTDRLLEIKSLHNEAGIKAYVFTRFTYDLLWPVIYTFFMVSTIAFMTRDMKASKILSFIKILPYLGFVFDILENMSCSLYFLSIAMELTGLIAPIFSAIKWISIALTMFLQVILFIYMIYRKFKR